MNCGNMGPQGSKNAVPILDEVPSVMKNLVRMVVDMFYTNEDKRIMNLLIHHGCINEDDIGQLLCFDKKLLRSRLSILKSDRLVKEGYLLEERPDDKPQKVFHIYIHYNCFINVVKYRLDKIAKDLEIFERQTISRCSFRCLGCVKVFEDLEFDQIYNKETDKLTCTSCGSVVEEAVEPAPGSRVMLATFNDQLKVIFDLLTCCEGMKLSRLVLEPGPVSIEQIRDKYKPREIEHVWSGEATRLKGLPTQNSKPRIQVTFNNDNDETGKVYISKELPIWLRNSTVLRGDLLEPHEPVYYCNAATGPISKNEADHENSVQEMINKKRHDEIDEMLMECEYD